MSNPITLAVYGGDLPIDEFVTVQAERLGGDHLLTDDDAAAVLESWIKDRPVSRNWGVAGTTLVLTDASKEGRPDIWSWQQVADGRYALGDLPFRVQRREFSREIEDAEALDKIVAAIYAPGVELQTIAELLIKTGRVVL